MSKETVLWIVVALVVIAVIVAAAAIRSRKGHRVQVRREEASELRERAERDRLETQRREADAAKVDAQARLAQAEADSRAAEAASLQVQAQERVSHAEESRSELEQKLRRADEVDPDVPDPQAGSKAPAGTGVQDGEPGYEDARTVDLRPTDEGPVVDEGQGRPPRP